MELDASQAQRDSLFLFFFIVVVIVSGLVSLILPLVLECPGQRAVRVHLLVAHLNDDEVPEVVEAQRGHQDECVVSLMVVRNPGPDEAPEVLVHGISTEARNFLLLPP